MKIGVRAQQPPAEPFSLGPLVGVHIVRLTSFIISRRHFSCGIATAELALQWKNRHTDTANGQDTKGKGKGKGTGEHTNTVQQHQLTWMSEPLLCHGTGTCPYCGIPYTHWWIYFVDTDDPEDVQPRPLRPEEEVALFMFRHIDDFICWR